jgi:hypothetical protein
MTDLDPTTTQPTVGSANATQADSPYEPAIDAAAALPVQASESPLRRRPIRWPVAIALVALVLAVSAVVGILVTGRAPNAKVLGYVPAGTVVYGEARLDLPGDQRLALASFLSKFPGFADQAAIESKLNEVMDRFVSGATNGDQAYTTDIQPWFDGELAFAVGPLPDPSALSGGGSAAMDAARYLALVSIKNEAGVTAWFRSVATSSKVTMSDAPYDGATLTMLTGENGGTAAYAVLDGKVAVLGDVASVKAAVDTQGKGPFAAQANTKAALDATDSGHVGFVYLDLGALLDWSTRASTLGGSTVTPGLDLSSGAFKGLIPTWEGLALRIEGDAVVLEAAADRPDASIGPADNRASTLTDHVPAGALVLTVNHDYGATLLGLLNAYRAEPSLKSVIDTIDQAAGVVGGTDGAVGWIGDTAIVVNQADGGIEGGLVILPTDRAVADRTFTSLRTLLALGGGQAGITVKDEPYAGTTITTLDLGDIATLAADAGIPTDTFGAGFRLPSGHIEIAYAISDKVVVIGSGPAFVKHVLDTTPGTSIASSDRFKSLSGRVGNGTSLAFIDVAAIRGLIESAMSFADPSGVAAYERDVKPYLAPFDALIASSSVSGDVSTSRFMITVK